MPTSEIMARALRAHHRHAGEIAQQPSEGASEIENIDGRAHAVLRNANGVLAVYRVANRGRLRRIIPSHWPAMLVEA